MKKILIVGGTGTIGKAVVSAFNDRHQIIIAGQTQGDIQVDVTDKASIQKMYQSVGKVDAVISTIGQVHFAPLTAMTNELYAIGLNNKLMGQVNLVLSGLDSMNDGGSFTLTSGILNRDPIKEGSSAAMVNGALDGFVTAAAIEMPRAIRINAVSPTVLTESMAHFGDYFLGFESAPAARVALAYVKSVEGLQTGQVYQVN
jgi:NAD(P)-dependent dehydrogenase (short-subunit alcohol dehydrogenase family)